jgi:GntR family transcriptional regulator
MAEQPRIVQRDGRANGIDAALGGAESLGIAPGAPLFRLERVRLLEGVPIALDLTRIPLALVPDIGKVDFGSHSLYSTLSEAGVEPMRADSTIEATKAGDRAAEHLRVAAGDPILVMHQLAVNADEDPLFASTIQYAGDRYRLRTSFARS